MPGEVYQEKQDKQLWLLFTRGDKQALSCIYCKYYNYLYNYGLKISADEDAVKDCIQELYLNLWANKEKSGQVTYVKAYLLQALRKNLITKIGRNKKHLLLQKKVFSSDSVFTFSTEDLLIQEEKSVFKSKQVVSALNNLTARQREAVYLRCYENLSYEEIALVMAVNYQSVVNHVHEAFKVLKKDEILKVLVMLSVLLTGVAPYLFI